MSEPGAPGEHLMFWVHTGRGHVRLTGGEQHRIDAGAGIWLFISGFVPSVLRGRGAIETDVAVALVLIVAAISAGIHLREEVRELDSLGVLPEARV